MGYRYRYLEGSESADRTTNGDNDKCLDKPLEVAWVSLGGIRL